MNVCKTKLKTYPLQKLMQLSLLLTVLAVKLTLLGIMEKAEAFCRIFAKGTPNYHR